MGSSYTSSPPWHLHGSSRTALLFCIFLWDILFEDNFIDYVRFQVLTAASMKFRIVFWDVLTCKVIVTLTMEAASTSETSVNNYFTWQYFPEDKSELKFH
jgi:hypothetical protein